MALIHPSFRREPESRPWDAQNCIEAHPSRSSRVRRYPDPEEQCGVSPEGEAAPLGVSLREEGINVAVVSQAAEAVFVSLFDGEEETARVPLTGRTGDVHHGFLPGIRAGQRYGLRAAGPWEPARAHRFDPAKLLLDPYARQSTGPAPGIRTSPSAAGRPPTSCRSAS